MILSRLGIESPHVAGNSLGGSVALELATVTPVSSITLLSPAGLWRGHSPRYCRVILTMVRMLALPMTDDSLTVVSLIARTACRHRTAVVDDIAAEPT